MPVLRTPIAALVVAVTLSLAGCGGGEPTGGGSPPTNPSASQSPSESSSPSVAPATGRRISTDYLSVHAPKGWVSAPGMTKQQAAAADYDIGAQVVINTLEWNHIDPSPVAAQARLALKQYDKRMRYAGPVTVAGQQMFHITGIEGGGSHLDEYGWDVPGAAHAYIHSISFFFRTTPPAQRQKIIDSVLATLEIKK
ncbi:hypothetical protein [Nocardioides sp. KR10-350]|uniref:hypothetical protein n=1 Tax=Nocardioides cheoyonin TaxID=3156615 RepID=UPI0032B4E135